VIGGGIGAVVIVVIVVVVVETKGKLINLAPSFGFGSGGERGIIVVTVADDVGNCTVVVVVVVDDGDCVVLGSVLFSVGESEFFDSISIGGAIIKFTLRC
jgi:hypothetical protein